MITVEIHVLAAILLIFFVSGDETNAYFLAFGYFKIYLNRFNESSLRLTL